MTKAEQVYEKVEALIASGKSKAEAFRQLAEETGEPLNTLRGAYYTHSSQQNGGRSRTRRRETTPEDAVADARAAMERALGSIDREVEAAKSRAEEAHAEYEARAASADERKQAIAAKLEALT